MGRLSRPLWWGLWVVMAWVLAGCSAIQTRELRAHQAASLEARQASDLPDRVELTQTPFFPQTEYHCGPAALATVMVAEGKPTTPGELAGAVFLPSRLGSLQAEMLAAGRRFGLVPTRLPGRLEPLLREVAAGHPVVVFLNLGLSFSPAWHYAVLVGYDLPAGKIILRSGTREREVMGMSTFEHTWVRAGSWAFGVRQPGQWPVTAEEKAVLEASFGFERAASPAQAAVVYASAIARWPANLSLQMGLANSLYASGDKMAAASAYKAAAALHQSSPAWINLGGTLLDLGDRPGAQRALAQAEALNESQWKPQVDALRARLNAPKSR